jgi:methanogenic corrinoid protein MtbC1
MPILEAIWMSGGERLYTAAPLLIYAGSGNDDSVPCDAAHINGKPPLHLLAGLAHEVVRRIAYREKDTDALPHAPSAEEVEELCMALLSNDGAASAEEIISSLAKDTTTEVIYLKYLAAAARMLGDWWTEDRVSFTDVTAATGRIFELLRKITITAHPGSNRQDLTVVFASVPGEHHTLGIRMAADLFRDDGWEIALKIGLSEAELVAEIKKLPRCIVGLSIGGRHSLDRLSGLVEALHRHCPQAVIVVSGQDVDELRPRLSAMGLDGVAAEINEAKEHISALWDREMARKSFSLLDNGEPEDRLLLKE